LQRNTGRAQEEIKNWEVYC